MSGEQAKQGAEAESTRGRSTINFPYSDQDDAVEVATAVHVVGGTSCDWDQLAAQMKQAAGGGGFRIRVMAARAFGLLTYDRGSVSLTDLGIRIVDPKFARIARAQSFLEVELFKTMYEKLKGGMLPPVAAIERAMEAAGVAPKQKDKARQVFIRSAKQAGYFELDQNRLTYPPVNAGGGVPKVEEKPLQEDQRNRSSGGGSGGGDDLHPFIKGLLEKLPQPESDWSIQLRAKWLQTAANIFDLMYKTDEQNKSIEVTVSGGQQ